jgi:SAM-dependent methyltransferase
MAHELRNTLVNRIHDRELKRCASLYLKGRLIDIGCGEKPYQQMLSSFVAEHIGVDHSDSPHGPSKVDLAGTAYQIPTDASFFDSAICTAVLEHLEEPEQALRECHRVLKPGGFAIYSVPFIWHLHEEPRDFYRFSRYGLHYLFEKCGFEMIELKPLSGFWVTFGQLLVYNLYRFNRGPLRWLRLVDMAGLLVQACAYGLDQVDRSEEWTWMYLVVARKREQ